MTKFTAINTFRGAFADVLEPENMRLIAVATWRALIVLSACIIAVSCTLGFFRLQDASAVFDVYAPAAAQQGPFTREDLNAAVAAFDARALRYQALSMTPLPDADPSQ